MHETYFSLFCETDNCSKYLWACIGNLFQMISAELYVH